MKKTLALVAVLTALTTLGTRAATPEQEKTFVESYRKALEANDTKTLNAFLLTDGAPADAVEFYKMMQALDPGSKLTSLTLEKLEAAEAAKFAEPQTMPDGKKYQMPVKVTHALVIKTETKDANGSSSGTSKAPVGEKNGKLVIPVPVPVK